MTLDLVVLGAIALFGLWGFFTGAARQIARFAGMIAAYAAAGPTGRFVGLPLANALGTSLTLGTVLGTVFCFIFIYIIVQVVLTAVLKRVFNAVGKRNGADRMLGMGLSAFKAAAMAYIGLCAASFMESNVVIAGRKLTFTPRDSQVMKLVHQYNLLERQQFGGLHDLVKAAKVTNDPRTAETLKNDPDFAALQRDGRFRAALSSEAMKKALDTGDVHALLSSNSIIELIHDPALISRIERVGDRLREH